MKQFVCQVGVPGVDSFAKTKLTGSIMFHFAYFLLVLRIRQCPNHLMWGIFTKNNKSCNIHITSKVVVQMDLFLAHI